MKIYLVLILMLYTLDGEMFYLLSTYSFKRSPNLTYGVLGLESDLKKDTRQYDFNKIDAFTGRNTIDNHRIRNFRRKREKETKNDIVGAIKEPMVFEDEKKMLKDGKYIKTGAIAYVKNGDKFFGKSSRGWLPFMMGPPVTNTTVNTTGPTTERPTKETIPKEVTNSIKEAIYETTMIKQPLPIEYMKKHPVHNPNKKELRLISTNKPYTGNMGGISNANLRCQKEAEFAGIDGIYRAFLASHDMVLDKLLSPDKFTTHEIVNIEGETLFKSFQDLVDQKGKLSFENNTIPLIYSFKRNNVFFSDKWEANLVWHGTGLENSTNITQCNDWTSNSSEHTGIASDVLYKGLLHTRPEPCNESLIVLCLEIGEERSSSVELHKVDYINKLLEYDRNKDYSLEPEDESSGSSSINDYATTENENYHDDSSKFKYKDNIYSRLVKKNFQIHY